MQTASSVHFTCGTVMVSEELVSTASEAQQAIQITGPHSYGISLVAQENILECTRHLCCVVRNDIAQKRPEVFYMVVQKPEGAPRRSQVVKPELLLCLTC